MRRAVTLVGFLMVALLPVAAVVSAQPADPSPVPVAISQPLGTLDSGLLSPDTAVLPESGLLVLIGSGLMGLAAVVRRTTRD